MGDAINIDNPCITVIREQIIVAIEMPNAELRGRPDRRDNAKQRRFGLSQ